MDYNLLLHIGFWVLGSLMLYFGADSLVKGSSRLALNLGITPLIIGLTVVAFGTSAPELIVSLSAGMRGKGDIAFGNVIGSNICNIALILGLSAVIKPVEVNLKAVSKDLWIMVLSSIAVIIMSLDGDMDFLDGLILVLGISAYIIYNIKKPKDAVPVLDVENISKLKYISDIHF